MISFSIIAAFIGDNGYINVTDKRPVNLDMLTIKLPLPALASITHRASGVFIFIGFAILIWMLEASLASEASFNGLKQYITSPLSKIVIWAVLAGFIYHTVAGVKHLINDMGIGETLEGGVLGTQIAMALSAVLIVLAGYWIW